MKLILLIILSGLLIPIASEAQLVNGWIDEYKQEIEIFREDSILVKTTIEGGFLAQTSNAINLESHPDAKTYSVTVIVDQGEGGKGEFSLENFMSAPKYNYEGFESLTTIGLPVKSYDEERTVSMEIKKILNSTRFISKLDFGADVKATNYSYRITIPKGLELSFQIHGDTTFFDKYSSRIKRKDKNIAYHFEATYPSDFFKVNGCIPRYIPSLKTLIHLEGLETEDIKELAALKTIERMKLYEPLADSIVRTCYTRFGSMGDPVEIARSVFKYLASRFKRADLIEDLVYFPIREITWLDEEDIWTTLELSALYSKLMPSFGLESRVAIAHSLIDPMDIDFFNPYLPQHILSVLEFGEIQIQADFNTGNFYVDMPSEAVQGKKLFVVNENRDEIYYNPVVSKEDNLSYCSTELWEKKGVLEGSSRIVYNGLSRTNLTDLLQRSRKEISHMIIEPVFAGDGEKIVYENYQFESNGDSLVLWADLTAKQLILNRKEIKYIYPEFNIFPHTLADKIKGCTEMRFVSSFAQLNAFETIVHFEYPVKLNQSYRMELDGEGIKFSYNVDQVDEKTLRYRYYFKLDNLFISGKSISEFNTFNSKFGRYMYTPMIVYNQK